METDGWWQSPQGLATGPPHLSLLLTPVCLPVGPTGLQCVRETVENISTHCSLSAGHLFSVRVSLSTFRIRPTKGAAGATEKNQTRCPLVEPLGQIRDQMQNSSQCDERPEQVQAWTIGSHQRVREASQAGQDETGKGMKSNHPGNLQQPPDCKPNPKVRICSVF